MTKLINAQFHELFKSKWFYISVIISAFCGAVFTAGMYLYPKFEVPENSTVVLNKDNILGIVPCFAVSIIPFAAGATVAAILYSHYSNGTVRNMLACGHTRSEIFFADTITMSAATVIYFLCYQLASFSLSIIAFDYDKYDLKAVMVSLSVMLVMIISTSTVVSILLGNIIRDGKLAIIILVVQYALGITIVFGLDNKESALADIVQKVFPQSCIFYYSCSSIPEGIAQKLTVSLAVTALLFVIGLLQFKKCDIK